MRLALGGMGVYLDAASTTPLHPHAREVLLAALDEGWADPARLYADGRQARTLLDAARAVVAEVLGVRPPEVAFVASGTHAVHTGLLGLASGRARAGSRVVASAVEHSAVFAATRWLTTTGGAEPEIVPVDRQGLVDTAAFVAAASRPGVAVATLQSANHEVGTRQPVEQVGTALREIGVPLFVDAAQTLGREPLPAGWTALAASAHKFGGPAGVGLLAVAGSARFHPPFPVDDRNLGGIRGIEVGMPPLPSIMATAAALQAAVDESAEVGRRHRDWTDRVRAALAGLADVDVLGADHDRLPHLVTASVFGVDGEALLGELDRLGFATNSGSSCTSSTLTPSHVLVAMGVLSQGNVRISLTRNTTEADIEALLTAFGPAVATVRERHAGVTSHAARPPESGSGSGHTVLDYRGRPCPAPVMALAAAVLAAEVGAVVAVEADDPAAPGDVAAWARMRGQELVSTEHLDDGAARITVRRIA